MAAPAAPLFRRTGRALLAGPKPLAPGKRAPLTNPKVLLTKPEQEAGTFWQPVRAGGEALQKGHMLSVLQVTPELNAGGVERTTIEMAEAISRAGGLALVASAGGPRPAARAAAGGAQLPRPPPSKKPP